MVGMACLVERDLESLGHLSPWLASVLVAPDYRGQGIGSALSERATQEAYVLGFERAYLFTFDMPSFYRRLGWVWVEDTTFLGHPVTVMSRTILAHRRRSVFCD